MQLTKHQRRPRLGLENPPRPDNLHALYRDTEDSFEQSRGMLKDWIRRIFYEFSLARFGQRTPLGVHRFLVLSLLAYLLAHWAKLVPGKEGLSWWEAVRLLLPEVVLRALLEELRRLGLWPPPSGRGGCLCGVFGRCKF